MTKFKESAKSALRKITDPNFHSLINRYNVCYNKTVRCPHKYAHFQDILQFPGTKRATVSCNAYFLFSYRLFASVCILFVMASFFFLLFFLVCFCNCCHAVCPMFTISACGTFSLGNLPSAIDESNGSCCATNSVGEVTASFVAPVANTYVFNTCSGNVDTCLYVSTGCGGPELGCSEDAFVAGCGPSGYGSSVSVALAAAQSIVVSVQGYQGSTSGEVLLSVIGCTPPPPPPTYVWQDSALDDSWSNGANWDPPGDGSYPNFRAEFSDIVVNQSLSSSLSPLVSQLEGVAHAIVSGEYGKISMRSGTTLQVKEKIEVSRSGAIVWEPPKTGVVPKIQGRLNIDGSGGTFVLDTRWEWCEVCFNDQVDCISNGAWENLSFLHQVSLSNLARWHVQAVTSVTFVALSFTGTAEGQRSITAPSVTLGRSDSLSGQGLFFGGANTALDVTANVIYGETVEFQNFRWIPYTVGLSEVEAVALQDGMTFRQSNLTSCPRVKVRCLALDRLCQIGLAGFLSNPCFFNEMQLAGGSFALSCSANSPQSVCANQVVLIENATVALTGGLSASLQIDQDSVVNLDLSLRGSVSVTNNSTIAGRLRCFAETEISIYSNCRAEGLRLIGDIFGFDVKDLGYAQVIGDNFRTPVILNRNAEAYLEGVFFANVTAFCFTCGIGGTFSGAVVVESGATLSLLSEASFNGFLNVRGTLTASSSSSAGATLGQIALIEGSAWFVSVFVSRSSDVQVRGTMRVDTSLILQTGMSVLGSLQFDSNAQISAALGNQQETAIISCASQGLVSSMSALRMLLTSGNKWSFSQCILNIGPGSSLQVTGDSSLVVLESPFLDAGDQAGNIDVILGPFAFFSVTHASSFESISCEVLQTFTQRRLVLRNRVRTKRANFLSDTTVMFELRGDGDGGILEVEGVVSLPNVPIALKFEGSYRPTSSFTLITSSFGQISGQPVFVDYGGLAAVASVTPFAVVVVPLSFDCPPGRFPVPSCSSLCPVGSFCQGGSVFPCSLGSVAPQPGTAICETCGPGTFMQTSELPCLPCAVGRIGQSFSAYGNNSCSLPCSSESSYCSLAAPGEVAWSELPDPVGTVRSSAIAFQPPSAFSTTSGGLIFLALGFGSITAVLVGVAIALFGLKRKGGPGWVRAKTLVSKVDLLYSTEHVNSPLVSQDNSAAGRAPVIERLTLCGGLMTVFAIISFLVLTAFIVVDWRSSVLVTSSVVPFGHIDASPNVRGKLDVVVDVFGYGQPCGDCSTISVKSNGISQGLESWICLRPPDSSACRVQWTSGNDANIGVNPTVEIWFSGGHASAYLWSTSLSPHWNPDSGAVNFFSQTVLPSNRSMLFKGEQPAQIGLVSSSVVSQDSTHLGKSGTGWLLSFLSSELPTQVSAANFTNTTNQVGLSFILDRGNTYLFVEWQYKTDVIVLIASIFAYFGTVTAVFLLIIKLVEWINSKMRAASSVDVPMENVSEASKNNLSAYNTTMDNVEL